MTLLKKLTLATKSRFPKPYLQVHQQAIFAVLIHRIAMRLKRRFAIFGLYHGSIGDTANGVMPAYLVIAIIEHMTRPMSE